MVFLLTFDGMCPWPHTNDVKKLQIKKSSNGEIQFFTTKLQIFQYHPHLISLTVWRQCGKNNVLVNCIGASSPDEGKNLLYLPIQNVGGKVNYVPWKKSEFTPNLPQIQNITGYWLNQSLPRWDIGTSPFWLYALVNCIWASCKFLPMFHFSLLSSGTLSKFQCHNNDYNANPILVI